MFSIHLLLLSRNVHMKNPGFHGIQTWLKVCLAKVSERFKNVSKLARGFKLYSPLRSSFWYFN